MEKEPKGCGFGKKCKPSNRELYKKIKTNVIRSNRWPSRYASYELVNKYKKAGGKYHCFGNCGCAKCNCTSFGASYESFYKPGVPKNTFLTPQVKQCLNVIYGPEDSGYTGVSYSPDIQRSLGFGSVNSEILYLKNILLH
jgi:hypothetical protein